MPFCFAMAPRWLSPSVTRFHSSSVKWGFGVEYGQWLSLYGVALLGCADHPRAHCVQKIALFYKLALDFFERFCRQEG